MEVVRSYHSAYDRYKDWEVRREERIKDYLKLKREIKSLKSQRGWRSNTDLKKLTRHKENRRTLMRLNKTRGDELSDELAAKKFKVKNLLSICITSVEDLDEALWLMSVNSGYEGKVCVKAKSKEIKQQILEGVRAARVSDPVAVQALKLHPF